MHERPCPLQATQSTPLGSVTHLQRRFGRDDTQQGAWNGSTESTVMNHPPAKTKLESGLTFLTFLQRSQLWADLESRISRFSGPGRMARGTTGPHQRTFSEARLVCASYDVLLQLLIHPCSLPIAVIPAHLSTARGIQTQVDRLACRTSPGSRDCNWIVTNDLVSRLADAVNR